MVIFVNLNRTVVVGPETALQHDTALANTSLHCKNQLDPFHAQSTSDINRQNCRNMYCVGIVEHGTVVQNSICTSKEHDRLDRIQREATDVYTLPK